MLLSIGCTNRMPSCALLRPQPRPRAEVGCDRGRHLQRSDKGDGEGQELRDMARLFDMCCRFPRTDRGFAEILCLTSFRGLSDLNGSKIFMNVFGDAYIDHWKVRYLRN